MRLAGIEPTTPWFVAKYSIQLSYSRIGGEGGIRTHGSIAATPDFESGTFDHSATSPQCRSCYCSSVFGALSKTRAFLRLQAFQAAHVGA